MFPKLHVICNSREARWPTFDQTHNLRIFHNWTLLVKNAIYLGPATPVALTPRSRQRFDHRDKTYYCQILLRVLTRDLNSSFSMHDYFLGIIFARQKLQTRVCGPRSVKGSFIRTRYGISRKNVLLASKDRCSPVVLFSDRILKPPSTTTQVQR